MGCALAPKEKLTEVCLQRCSDLHLEGPNCDFFGALLLLEKIALRQKKLLWQRISFILVEHILL